MSISTKGFEYARAMLDYAEDGDLTSSVPLFQRLTFNTVNAIEQFTEDAYQVEQAEDGGLL